MSILDYLESKRKQEFLDSDQLSLGQIIQKLEACGIKQEDGEDKNVYFDFGSAVPTYFASWRGSYSELALGYKLTGYDSNTHSFNDMTVEKLLKECKEALETEFQGWKGGEYYMSKDTPVWVANSGNSGNTGIIDVVDDNWRIILMTSWIEF